MSHQNSSMTGASGGGPVSPQERSPATRAINNSEKKIGHRRVGEGGVTFKKIQTSEIMDSIQLGIRNAVGGLASKPERDILVKDVGTEETTKFDAKGSKQTPAHRNSDFRFTSFASMVFRHFRYRYQVQPDEFLLSLCDEPLRELTNPGASGSIFYLSADDKFIIKTVSLQEQEFLRKLLVGYYMNLNQNPLTLLPKFYGLYCYQCMSKNIRIVVMNNLLPSTIKFHEKYDLKGSTYKRKASDAERSKSVPTFKDLDFLDLHPDGILLEADTYNALVKTIQRDCIVLESFEIMDYSLLVAVHNLDVAAREESERRRNNSADAAAAVSACAPSPTRLVRNDSSRPYPTDLESIQAESEPIEEENEAPKINGIPARNAKGEQLLLFIGIIDILQSYGLKKKLEHALKAILHDGDTVSVHRPGFYSQRFQNFMAKKVFRKMQSPSVRPSVGVEDIGELRSVPSSTPPPAFDDVVRSGFARSDPQSNELAVSSSSVRLGVKQKQPVSSSSDIANRLESQIEVSSISTVHLEVRSDSRASSLRIAEVSRRTIAEGSSTSTYLRERTLSLTDSYYSGELVFPSSPGPHLTDFRPKENNLSRPNPTS